MRFDGFHALASLDGAPLIDRERAILDLPGADQGACPDRHLLAMTRDAGRTSPVTGTHALLGHIDEPAALARMLGLSPTTPPADLMLAAMARYGDDTPMRVGGEWSFLHWDTLARVLTLMVADTARDAIVFTTDGRRVAVASNVRTLRQLDGVDATPDATGLLLHLGRGAARAVIGERTILSDVRRVASGTLVRIAQGEVTVGARAELPEPQRWRGSFDDAIDAIDATLRTIIRQSLDRHPSAAVMLSGGLDSTLIAAFAAAERGEAHSLITLTSAVPRDSKLLDETADARTVADHLAISSIPVVPDEGCDVYHPSAAMMRTLDHPPASPRHYVYDALFHAAVERDASAIFDGSEGELTVTGYRQVDGRLGWLRSIRTRILHTMLPRNEALLDAFHVRLSRDALIQAENLLADKLAAATRDAVWRRERIWGYHLPAIAKNRSLGTATHFPGLRHLMPFRDRRLLTLCAGMPVEFLTHGGLTRAPGRSLLAGKVPDPIRLRQQGRPFSPDYFDRIRRDAPRARDRIAFYASLGVGQWLDLDWLDASLMQIERGNDRSLDIFQVQSTAMAAAFLADWAAGS